MGAILLDRRWARAKGLILPASESLGRRLTRLSIPKDEGFRRAVIDRYEVCIDSVCSAKALVAIAVRNGIGYYLIEEPPLDEQTRNLLVEVMNYVYASIPLSKALDPQLLREEVLRAASELGLAEELRERMDSLWYYVLREMMYSVITIPLMDPYVEDVELSDWRSPVTVVHRAYSDIVVPGGLVTNIRFASEEEARAMVVRLGVKAGKSVSLARPRLQASLPEGYRVAATLGEVSEGPTFDIRKFPTVPIVVTTLIREGVLSPLMAAYYWLINDTRQFYMIVGGSGVGKTTMLNALLMLTHPMWKIVVIEDVPEIVIKTCDEGSRHRVVKFLSNERATAFDLAVDALRYRPDIIVVGEVRGREIEALVRAVASGSGSATTFHASTPEEVMMAVRNLLPHDLYALFIANIASIAFIAKVFHSREGRYVRRVVGVYEYSDGRWVEVFRWLGDNDRYEPSDPRAVVRASRAMKRAAAFLVMSPEDLVDELRRRAEFLGSLAEEEPLDPLEEYRRLSLAISEFYREEWGRRG